VHGSAVGLLLPHVVRFNAGVTTQNPYAAICDDAEDLARRLEQMLDYARLPRTLSACNVPESALPDLAEEAAAEWTAGFNPVKVWPSDLLRIYRAAFR
jgi:alcohol dehydrogenase